MVVVARWKKKLTEEKEDEMELDNMERVYVVNIPNLPQYKKKIDRKIDAKSMERAYVVSLLIDIPRWFASHSSIKTKWGSGSSAIFYDCFGWQFILSVSLQEYTLLALHH